MFLRIFFEIFQQANSIESILGEISLLRQQCAQFIAEKRLRRTKSDGTSYIRGANVRVFKATVSPKPN